MLRKLMVSTVAGAALALSTGAFAQGQFGTAAEAKAMLEKAVTELKANEAAALAKFNKGEGGFKDRDLYVFCFDMNGRKMTAHVNQSLIGSAPGDIKEKDGSPLGEKVVAAMKEGTVSTVSYNFPKPGTTEPVPKESFVTQVGNQGCGVGYYK
jgi:cytochrome c